MSELPCESGIAFVRFIDENRILLRFSSTGRDRNYKKEKSSISSLRTIKNQPAKQWNIPQTTEKPVYRVALAKIYKVDMSFQTYREWVDSTHVFEEASDDVSSLIDSHNCSILRRQKCKIY